MRSKAIIVLIFLLLPVICFSRVIEVTGQGPTKDMAIKDGIRQAIEIISGTTLRSITEVGNGKLIYDNIVSSSSGFCLKKEILSERRDSAGNYLIKMRVDIDENRLNDTIERCLMDPSCVRLHFDKRIIVIYKPSTTFDLPYNSRPVRIVMNLIQDKLVDYGFRVFLPEQLKKVKIREAEMANDIDTALKIAKLELADAMIVVSIDAGKRYLPDDSFYMIKASLSLKAYDPTTGELYANVYKEGKNLSQGGDYGILDGIAYIMRNKIGKSAVKELAIKIIKRLLKNTIIVAFVNVSSLQIDKISEIMRDLGVDYRLNSQTSKFVEYEIRTVANTSSIKELLWDKIRKANIYIKLENIEGNRIIFKGY